MLSIEQLIKIILGILVFIAVVIGIYLFFKNSIIDFFNNVGGNSTSKLILPLIK